MCDNDFNGTSKNYKLFPRTPYYNAKKWASAEKHFNRLLFHD